MRGRKEKNYIQSCLPDVQHVNLAQWCWVIGNLLHLSLPGRFYNISKTTLFHTVHQECCYTAVCSLFPLLLYLWPTTIKLQKSNYLMYFRRGMWLFKTICVLLEYNTKRSQRGRLAKLSETESCASEPPTQRENTRVLTTGCTGMPKMNKVLILPYKCPNNTI